jgi:hypothetical protein
VFVWKVGCVGAACRSARAIAESGAVSVVGEWKDERRLCARRTLQNSTCEKALDSGESTDTREAGAAKSVRGSRRRRRPLDRAQAPTRWRPTGRDSDDRHAAGTLTVSTHTSARTELVCWTCAREALAYYGRPRPRANVHSLADALTSCVATSS